MGTKVGKTPARVWAARIARLTVFLGATAAVLAYVDYRVARASVMERLVGIGTRMAPYLDDARSTEAPRQVRINGIKLWVAAGRTQHPPAWVKRWYKDRYAAKDDGFDQLAQDMKKRGVPPLVDNLNQMEFGDGEQGGVAALDFGQKLSMQQMKDRLLRFVDKGDLGAVGKLRYVWVEKRPDGGSRFLTVWTDDDFQLEQLMPADRKDAPGFDLADVPRYPGTQRILSAEEKGMPQRMVVYDGTGSSATAQLFYRGRMQTLGWMEDTAFSEMAEQRGHRALKFGNAKGHEVVLDLVDSPTGVTICAIQTH